MATCMDYLTLTECELAEELVASVAELGDQSTTDRLTVDEIIGKVATGMSVIVKERDAIAVVHLEGMVRKVNPVLWLLFVRPSARRFATGKNFVMSLRSRFEISMPMVVLCNGTQRESFFSACGFEVYERCPDGEVIMRSTFSSCAATDHKQ